MATKEIKIVEGEVVRDRFGSWSDCSPGLYIDTDMVESIFNAYKGKRIRVTIEVVGDTLPGDYETGDY
jgi:hypothetical protein